MQADINKQIAFRQHKAMSNLRTTRHSGVVTHQKSSSVNRALYEERVDKAHESKRLKYKG